jgi:hypothetical protein
MKITNTQPGPRGINTVNGPVLVDPRQTVDVNIYAREQKHLEASGWFEINGDFTANPGEAHTAAEGTRDENGDTPDMATMRRQFDASYADITSQLQTSTAEVEKLTAELATANAEISKLKQSQAPASLKAEHHGGGKFNITQGEAVLAQGLSKADADAFNAMSDAEKAAYVKESKPA